MEWKYVSLLLLLLMMKNIQGQQYNELVGNSCTSKQDISYTDICTVTIYCDNSIIYTDSTFSSIRCFHTPTEYRRYRPDRYRDRIDKKKNYEGSFDLVLEFKNMKIDEFNKEILPSYLSRNKVKKIRMNKLEIGTIPSQITNFDSITHFKISESALETIDFSIFDNKHNLVHINVSNNRISVLESKEVVSSSTHSIELIDLSNNLIQTLPNNYFYRFPNLLHLNLSHNYIEKFEILTFEGLSRLQTLHLSYNNLIVIDLSFVRFGDLRELMLDHNQITFLKESNFKVMTQLQILNLTSNHISEIEDTTFQTLSELTTLDLSNNAIPIIVDKTFQNNTKLNVLALSHNNITSISVGLFTAMNLTHFNINNNSISGTIGKYTFRGISEDDFDLSNNKIESLGSDVFSSFGSELKYLNLSNNNIFNVSSSAFLSVEYLNSLDISFNRLSKIDGYLKNLKEMTYLNMSNNYVRRLSKISFEDLISLITLDLSVNPIKEIENDTFSNLRKLETLILCNTQLTNPFTPHTLRGMVALKAVYLMNIDGTTNYQKYAFSGMSELKLINSTLSNLLAIDFDAFNDTGSIEIMDFSHNLLENFAVDTNSIYTVKELYLHNNRIYNINLNMFQGLTALLKLTLGSNHIVQVYDNSLTSLSKLEYLDLSHNEQMVINGSQIENITSLYSLVLKNIKTHLNFCSVTTASVRVLDMSQSNIDDIKLRCIYNLKTVTDLNLSLNKITYVDKHSFQTMPVLFYLNLSHNHIQFIQPGSFIHTSLIKNINLHDNDIIKLQYGVFNGLQNLEILNLSSNSLSSFEVNILHNSPAILNIVLDDNFIVNINLDSFEGKRLNELSIGGNPINCDVIIDFKNREHSFKITAQVQDFHSENVNGITCKTLTNTNVINKQSNNTILPNITAAFDSLTNAMDMCRTTIEHVANTNINATQSNKDIEDVLVSINKLVKLVNDSQLLTNDLLQRMIENKGKQTEQIQVKSENNVRDINTPIYITLVCLILLSGVLIFLSFSYFKWKSRALESNNFSSNRHFVANEMEME